MAFLLLALLAPPLPAKADTDQDLYSISLAGYAYGSWTVSRGPKVCTPSDPYGDGGESGSGWQEFAVSPRPVTIYLDLSKETMREGGRMSWEIPSARFVNRVVDSYQVLPGKQNGYCIENIPGGPAGGNTTRDCGLKDLYDFIALGVKEREAWIDDQDKDGYAYKNCPYKGRSSDFMPDVPFFYLDRYRASKLRGLDRGVTLRFPKTFREIRVPPGLPTTQNGLMIKAPKK